jgi:hypothetical protein
MVRRDTRTRQFYTGSGLWRVKPYVQFFGLYSWRGKITWRPIPGRTPLPALYWATDKVGGPESKSVTTGKPISSQLQHGKLIRAALIRLDCLVLHAKLSSCLWATCQVGQAYWQFGWSSSRPDPLVGDDREPGRWGPRGTHVSHSCANSWETYMVWVVCRKATLVLS